MSDLDFGEELSLSRSEGVNTPPNNRGGVTTNERGSGGRNREKSCGRGKPTRDRYISDRERDRYADRNDRTDRYADRNYDRTDNRYADKYGDIDNKERYTSDREKYAPDREKYTSDHRERQPPSKDGPRNKNTSDREYETLSSLSKKKASPKKIALFGKRPIISRQEPRRSSGSEPRKNGSEPLCIEGKKEQPKEEPPSSRSEPGTTSREGKRDGREGKRAVPKSKIERNDPRFESEKERIAREEKEKSDEERRRRKEFFETENEKKFYIKLRDDVKKPDLKPREDVVEDVKKIELKRSSRQDNLLKRHERNSIRLVSRKEVNSGKKEDSSSMAISKKTDSSIMAGTTKTDSSISLKPKKSNMILLTKRKGIVLEERDVVERREERSKSTGGSIDLRDNITRELKDNNDRSRDNKELTIRRKDHIEVLKKAVDGVLERENSSRDSLLSKQSSPGIPTNITRGESIMRAVERTTIEPKNKVKTPFLQATKTPPKSAPSKRRYQTLETLTEDEPVKNDKTSRNKRNALAEDDSRLTNNTKDLNRDDFRRIKDAKKSAVLNRNASGMGSSATDGERNKAGKKSTSSGKKSTSSVMDENNIKDLDSDDPDPIELEEMHERVRELELRKREWESVYLRENLVPIDPEIQFRSDIQHESEIPLGAVRGLAKVVMWWRTKGYGFIRSNLLQKCWGGDAFLRDPLRTEVPIFDGNGMLISNSNPVILHIEDTVSFSHVFWNTVGEPMVTGWRVEPKGSELDLLYRNGVNLVRKCKKEEKEETLKSLKGDTNFILKSSSRQQLYEVFENSMLDAVGTTVGRMEETTSTVVRMKGEKPLVFNNSKEDNSQSSCHFSPRRFRRNDTIPNKGRSSRSSIESINSSGSVVNGDNDGGSVVDGDSDHDGNDDGDSDDLNKNMKKLSKDKRVRTKDQYKKTRKIREIEESMESRKSKRNRKQDKKALDKGGKKQNEYKRQNDGKDKKGEKSKKKKKKEIVRFGATGERKKSSESEYLTESASDKSDRSDSADRSDGGSADGSDRSDADRSDRSDDEDDSLESNSNRDARKPPTTWHKKVRGQNERRKPADDRKRCSKSNQSVQRSSNQGRTSNGRNASRQVSCNQSRQASSLRDESESSSSESASESGSDSSASRKRAKPQDSNGSLNPATKKRRVEVPRIKNTDGLPINALSSNVKPVLENTDELRTSIFNKKMDDTTKRKDKSGDDTTTSWRDEAKRPAPIIGAAIDPKTQKEKEEYRRGILGELGLGTTQVGPFVSTSSNIPNTTGRTPSKKLVLSFQPTGRGRERNTAGHITGEENSHNDNMNGIRASNKGNSSLPTLRRTTTPPPGQQNYGYGQQNGDLENYTEVHVQEVHHRQDYASPGYDVAYAPLNHKGGFKGGYTHHYHTTAPPGYSREYNAPKTTTYTTGGSYDPKAPALSSPYANGNVLPGNVPAIIKKNPRSSGGAGSASGTTGISTSSAGNENQKGANRVQSAAIDRPLDAIINETKRISQQQQNSSYQQQTPGSYPGNSRFHPMGGTMSKAGGKVILTSKKGLVLKKNQHNQ